MELLEDRHGLGSTLIASQLPVDSWHEYEYIGEATLADAILRLIHNAHRLPLLNSCAGYHQKLHLVHLNSDEKKEKEKEEEKLTIVTDQSELPSRSC